MSKCPTIRRKRLEISSLNIMSGATSEPRVEWRTEPCGSPLFGEDAKLGVCKSCRTGWQTDTNYPVDENGERIAAQESC